MSDCPTSAAGGIRWDRGHLAGTLPLPGHFAVTLDDGPVAAVTPQVLAMLRRYGLHATFFVVGQHVVKAPALLRQILAEGHTIGCHTYDHVDAATMDVTTILDQMARNQAAVDAALGRPYPLRQFRPAYGTVTGGLRTALRAREADLVMWHHSTSDGSAPLAPPETLMAAIAASLTSADWSGILLAHDAYPQSPNVLEAFIRHALGRGLQAVTTGQIIDGIRSQAGA
jgi:peptidoglycan/xylan/chitin deacetylase (PgdA/CDA1 family)